MLRVDFIDVKGNHVSSASSEGVLFGSMISLEDFLGIIAKSTFNSVSDRRRQLHHLLHMEVIKPAFDR